VYAVDVQELAIATVKRKMAKRRLANVVPTVARGYDSGVPGEVADMVCALDMFFGLDEPTTFLREVRRIIKPSGTLILDDGHQSRGTTLAKLHSAGGWRVTEETRDHLRCEPIPTS